MNQYNDEFERPSEWLTRLREDTALYRSLLDDAGSLAIAAYRVACARCRIATTPVAVPNSAELYAAAREIQDHVPAVACVPPAMDLAGDCDAEGVPVLLWRRAFRRWNA